MRPKAGKSKKNVNNSQDIRGNEFSKNNLCYQYQSEFSRATEMDNALGN